MNQVMVDWTVIAHLVLTEIRDFVLQILSPKIGMLWFCLVFMFYFGMLKIIAGLKQF